MYFAVAFGQKREDMAAGNTVLGVTGLNKAFGALVVAEDISFTVDNGMAFGIIGPNGAGKTTLFNLVTGTLRPASGQVSLFGEDVSHLGAKARCAKGVARSFQVPQPFSHMSAFENVLTAAAFGRGISEAAAWPFAEEPQDRCGLGPQSNRLAGHLTLLDRKRLELARALATNPRILMLDEIAGGLTEVECHDLIAAGLSLVFGVMRLVNIAHGDFIVLGAYIAMMFVTITGLHPLLTLILVVPLMGLIGYALQRIVLERTLGEDLLPPILVTFGLAVIIQNGLLALFSTDAQRLGAGAIETASVPIGQISVGVLPLLTFVIAVVLIALMEKVFFRSQIGRAFRVTSDDAETARAIGVNTRHVFGLAMALSFGVIAIAAVLLAARSSFDPFSGPARLLYGFEAVIIGGLGNLWGTLAGGVVLGVAQTLGAQIWPSMQILSGISFSSSCWRSARAVCSRGWIEPCRNPFFASPSACSSSHFCCLPRRGSWAAQTCG